MTSTRAFNPSNRLERTPKRLTLFKTGLSKLLTLVFYGSGGAAVPLGQQFAAVPEFWAHFGLALMIGSIHFVELFE